MNEEDLKKKHPWTSCDKCRGTGFIGTDDARPTPAAPAATTTTIVRPSRYWPLLCSFLIGILIFEMYMIYEDHRLLEADAEMLNFTQGRYLDTTYQTSYASAIAQRNVRDVNNCVRAYLQLYNVTIMNGTMSHVFPILDFDRNDTTPRMIVLPDGGEE